MMCGLLRPTYGVARVVGYDLYRAGGKARTRLGYMAQKFSLYGDLSVQENLDFFAGVYGLSGARRQQATARMIEMISLQAYANANSGSLSTSLRRAAIRCRAENSGRTSMRWSSAV